MPPSLPPLRAMLPEEACSVLQGPVNNIPKVPERTVCPSGIANAHSIIRAYTASQRHLRGQCAPLELRMLVQFLGA